MFNARTPTRKTAREMYSIVLNKIACESHSGVNCSRFLFCCTLGEGIRIVNLPRAQGSPVALAGT